MLRVCLYDEIPENLSNKTRKDLVELLCKYRKEYFRENPQVYEDALASVENLDKADTITSRESRQQQIKSTIYSLDADAIASFQSEH